MINNYVTMDNSIQELIRMINRVPRIGIYTRVSTSEQAETGYSIDEQERLLIDWCNKNGLEVFNCYSDRGISGKNIKLEIYTMNKKRVKRKMRERNKMRNLL